MYVCIQWLPVIDRCMYLFRRTKINKRCNRSNTLKYAGFLFFIQTQCRFINALSNANGTRHVIRYVIAHSIFALRSKRDLNPTFIINQTFSFFHIQKSDPLLFIIRAGKLRYKNLKKRIARRTIFGCEFFRQGPSR
jgi:hypothetical protein